MHNAKERPFRLHKKERTGVIVLLLLLCALMLAWRILPMLYSSETDTGTYTLAWEHFKSKNAAPGPERGPLASGEDSVREPKAEQTRPGPGPAPLDPNKASETELLSLGLPMRTVRNLIHYREKGGRFYKKEDLKKLYTLSGSDYERIEPYIRITGQSGRRHIKQIVAEIIDLNEADTGMLIRLPGIGPVYARRIIAFREALGGFVSVSQLKEVYGFPDSTYRQLKSRFSINPEKIRKVNINTADAQEFYRQPYLRRYAGKIIRLRKKVGKFEDISAIRQISLINDENYRKIAPYLTVQ